MAEWKKVIVSGSNISQLNNDSNYLVSGDTTILSGSFSGSFQGDGSGLTGIVATAESLTNALSSGVGISPFTYNAEIPLEVAVSGAADLSANAITKWNDTDGKFANSSLTDNGTLITGGTSIRLTGGISSLTGSFKGTFSGSGVNISGVVLGANTTGDYVANLGTGTGVTIGSNTGEGSTPTIAVNYGTTANTAVQGNVTLTVLGTTNEVEVTGGAAAALGANRSITVGLPNDVTITGGLVVGGNLRVNGDVTQVNTTNLEVEDTFILLNSGSAANTDSGIIFGGTNGVAQSGTGLVWDASYNANDGRLGIVSTIASNATGAQTMAYYVGGVFEGTVANAATAQADHNGNIRIEAGDIFIYA